MYDSFSNYVIPFAQYLLSTVVIPVILLIFGHRINRSWHSYSQKLRAKSVREIVFRYNRLVRAYKDGTLHYKLQVYIYIALGGAVVYAGNTLLFVTLSTVSSAVGQLHRVLVQHKELGEPEYWFSMSIYGILIVTGSIGSTVALLYNFKILAIWNFVYHRDAHRARTILRLQKLDPQFDESELESLGG